MQLVMLCSVIIRTSDLESVQQCWDRGANYHLSKVSCLTTLTIYLQSTVTCHKKIKSCRISDVIPPTWVGWKTTSRRGWLAFYWTCATHMVPSVWLWFQVCRRLSMCVLSGMYRFFSPLVIWLTVLIIYKHLFNVFSINPLNYLFSTLQSLDLFFPTPLLQAWQLKERAW